MSHMRITSLFSAPFQIFTGNKDTIIKAIAAGILTDNKLKNTVHQRGV